MYVDLFYPVLLPILGGAFFLLLPKRWLRPAALCLQLPMLAMAAINFQTVKLSAPFEQTLGGWPRFLGISLYADAVSCTFVLMTVVLFTCFLLYSFDRETMTPLFFFLMAVMQGLTVGIFLSYDVFNIFVLVEVATVVISIAIMYKKDSRAVYDGLLYLMVNVVAMSLFLLGIGMLYKSVGALNLGDIHERLHMLPSARPVIVPYALMMTAVGLKAALMPLFSWLPKAHGTPSAPSAVSAMLSGIYVKGGIYLFMRLQQTFSPVIDTSGLFLVIGFVTAVAGFLLAIAQKDIKLILAYHTVSQIGMIMMGLTMGNSQAYMGAIYHIINHAFFKSTLFLTAGLVIDTYGTRNIYEIRGVFKRMPIVSIAAIMAILGITGAPLFNGSISKYLIAYTAKGSVMEIALLLVNLGTIVSFVKYSRIFFGDGQRAAVNVTRQSTVFAMGLACLFGGILGQPILNYLFNISFAIDPAAYAQKAFIFSLSLATGVLLYRAVIQKLDLSGLVKRLDVSFRGVCIAMGVFLFGLLAYLRFFM